MTMIIMERQEKKQEGAWRQLIMIILIIIVWAIGVYIGGGYSVLAGV